MSIRKRKCHPYMVDGTIVLPEKKPEYPLGTVLDTPDLPLKRPLYERKPKGKLNGILLALHGCSRLRSIPRGQKRWFSYFEARGLYVIAPNSFAESRLPERCPPTRGKNLAPLETVSHGGEIVRFRVAQTRRTIRLLREMYPDLPIIIWGHSEGGAVAQLIPDNVSGVIVSGALCGIRRSKDLMVKRNIPLLLLLGDKDTLVNPETGVPFDLAQYCGEVLRSPIWKFVLLRGVGHTPSIRSKAVRRPISAFIDSVLDQHAPN
jgi:poly(3-hydroxybutyrate) depolymerase